MNGFLVTVGTSLDDIPVALFATRDEAVAYAESDLASIHRDARKVNALMERDEADFAGTIDVAQFVDGVCVAHEMVREYDN